MRRTRRPWPLEVLLVEDDDIDARIIRLVADLIDDFELRVTRVSSLADAETAMDRTKFDVCLLDFWLGRESSLRFLSALEAMDCHIGTVVLSNISPREVTNFRLATRRNYFLPKGEMHTATSAARDRIRCAADPLGHDLEKWKPAFPRDKHGEHTQTGACDHDAIPIVRIMTRDPSNEASASD